MTEGFFWNEAGFLGMTGRRDLLFSVAESAEAGTGASERSDGFLCVISLLSTCRSPLVTVSPLLRSAKTALISALGFEADAAAGAADAPPAGGGGGGAGAPPAGGGGGGAGAPVDGFEAEAAEDDEDDLDARYEAISCPCKAVFTNQSIQ